jgi:soluble lytic murein transglycosylase-like protein
MATIQGLITQAAGKYGIDPALALAVAQQESGFQQGVISGSGAIGVMQLMPATAAGLGVNPNNLEENIDGGVRYLAQMLRQFGGDVSLALAAYNAGPGNVNKYGGIPPFQETENYVNSVLALTGAYGSENVVGSDSILGGRTGLMDILTTPSTEGLVTGGVLAILFGGLVAWMVWR